MVCFLQLSRPRNLEAHMGLCLSIHYNYRRWSAQKVMLFKRSLVKESDKGSQKEHRCEIWLKIIQWFHRRCLNEKVYGWRAGLKHTQRHDNRLEFHNTVLVVRSGGRGLGNLFAAVAILLHFCHRDNIWS